MTNKNTAARQALERIRCEMLESIGRTYRGAEKYPDQMRRLKRDKEALQKDVEEILTALKTQEKLENGYVLVPIEPTDAICGTLKTHHVEFDREDGRFLLYKAMITQAQENEG
jgi:hypothetical protein